MKATLLGIFLTLAAWGVPEKIELVDGRTLEQVTEVGMETGKIRILHSAGVSRLEPEKVTAASLKEIGGEFSGVEVATKPVLALTRLETLDGKIYEGLRNVRMKPSFIQFSYDGGATSVRFDNLPEAIRQQCGYDKALAAAFDSEENARRATEARKDQEAEQAVAKAKSKAEAREMAQDKAFRDAVVRRIEQSMELRRTYGSDLGGYIDRNERMWQREADLHAAMRAKALQGR